MATSCVIGHSRTLLRWRNDAMATRSHSAAARTRNAAARSARRGRLAPGKQARGLDAAEVAIAIDSAAVAPLAALVREAGGAPIGAYHEPLGGRTLLRSEEHTSELQ